MMWPWIAIPNCFAISTITRVIQRLTCCERHDRGVSAASPDYRRSEAAHWGGSLGGEVEKHFDNKHKNDFGAAWGGDARLYKARKLLKIHLFMCLGVPVCCTWRACVRGIAIR